MGEYHLLLRLQTQVLSAPLLKECLAFLDAFQLDLLTLLDIFAVVSKSEAIADGFVGQSVVHLGFQLLALFLQGLSLLVLLLLSVGFCLALLPFLFFTICIGNIRCLLFGGHNYLRKRLLDGGICSSLSDCCTNGSTSGHRISTRTSWRRGRERILDCAFDVVELCYCSICNGLETLFETILYLSPVKGENAFYYICHGTQFVDQ